MTYRTSFRSNPRLFVLSFIILLLAAAAIGLLVAFGPLAGIIALLVAAYIIYHLVKFLRMQLASYLEISEDGIRCLTSIGEKLEYTWTSITHSGILREPSGKKWVYLYDENEDRLLTIPETFENIAGLTAELADHVTLKTDNLGLGETVQDRLKKMVGPSQVVVDDDEDEPESEAGSSGAGGSSGNEE